MKINCLGCGHTVDLGESYDDYDGPVKCNICRTTMKIVSENGKIRSSDLTEDIGRREEVKEDK